MVQAPQRRTAQSAGEEALSYKSVGVASSEEMRSFGRAIELFRSTHTFAVGHEPLTFEVGELYASLLPLTNDLHLAIATDGVGTKILVAEALGKYDTVGIDCVAMNANDILCVGAKPIAMVDYMAVKSTDSEQIFELAQGLVEGARQAQISIPGGEVAQVSEMLADTDDAFDLVGTCVGMAASDELMVGQSIEEDDAIIGFASTGIHSNGLTLARRAFDNHKIALTDHVPEFGATLGEELLAPTQIYVDLALNLRRALDVHAFDHITSDGFINLTRVPPAVFNKVGFAITDLPDPPPVFTLTQQLGGVDDEDVFRVFNMGIGFCAIVPERHEAEAIATGEKLGIKAHRIGTVTTDHPGRVTIDAGSVHLKSEGKRFKRR